MGDKLDNALYIYKQVSTKKIIMKIKKTTAVSILFLMILILKGKDIHFEKMMNKYCILNMHASLFFVIITNFFAEKIKK